MSASLSLQNISLFYGATVVIRDLSLTVDPGEMIALLGESGSGKTTILKLIAGLLHPDHGVVAVNGNTLDGIPTEARRNAMVFQKPLLFPYLPVGENIGFSLKLKGASAAAIREKVREALAMVRLDGYESRRPNQLSGGQEQRVSLARALVSDPQILLLDEPFAALDENLRAEIRSLVRSIQRRLQLTTVFVTHDRNEAAAVAPRIAFLHAGRVSQIGTLPEFYEQPANLAAARFFGWQLLKGKVEHGILRTALGETPTEHGAGPAWAAVRAATIRTGTGVEAQVESSVDLGAQVSTIVKLPTGESLELHHSPPELTPGQTVKVSAEAQSLRVFSELSEAR